MPKYYFDKSGRSSVSLILSLPRSLLLARRRPSCVCVRVCIGQMAEAPAAPASSFINPGELLLSALSKGFLSLSRLPLARSCYLPRVPWTRRLMAALARPRVHYETIFIWRQWIIIIFLIYTGKNWLIPCSNTYIYIRCFFFVARIRERKRGIGRC